MAWEAQHHLPSEGASLSWSYKGCHCLASAEERGLVAWEAQLHLPIEGASLSWPYKGCNCLGLLRREV